MKIILKMHHLFKLIICLLLKSLRMSRSLVNLSGLLEAVYQSGDRVSKYDESCQI